ncbi:MAG: sigma-54 dependent transcriptional regulator [Pyrinomonadaceae bacterium]
MKKILVVDDDAESTELLKEIFQAEKWEVRTANNFADALAAAGECDFDLVVSDINLEDEMSGLDLLREVSSSVPVILVSGFGSLEIAVEAARDGAWDFVSKPYKVEELVQTARRAIDRGKSDAPETEQNESRVSTAIIGRSAPMIELYKEIARVAPTLSTVLITGESGTGKELVARAIHDNSNRRNGPFVAVNCGALTESLLESELFGYVKGSFTGANSDRNGLWEEARDGTLFLDEIGEISLQMQVKLLRVLQENEIRKVGATRNIPVNARIIAATNRNLEEEVEGGTFREDLFYRLSVFGIPVPPLRDRKGDIPLLAEGFLKKTIERTEGNQVTLSSEALKLLTVYDWKGNVRELEAAVEFAVLHARGKEVLPEDLPEKLRTPEYLHSASRIHLSELYADFPTLEDLEKRYLVHVLEETEGNRTRAAEILGIDRRTLYRMAERFEISLD